MTQTLPPVVPSKQTPPDSAKRDAFPPPVAAMEPEHDWGVAFSTGDRARAHVEGTAVLSFLLIVVEEGIPSPRLRSAPSSRPSLTI